MKHVLIFNLFISAQRDASQVQSVRNTQETNGRRRPRHEGRSSSVPSDSPWTEHEIWIFLQEWEVVEYEIGHPGRKLKKKVRSLCGRLYKRGLRKSWNSCLDLMLKMMDLHETLCNDGQRPDPLYSPYAWDLYKILGHKSLRSHVPVPSCCSWTDLEIRIFLQEWEVVEQEIHHPGKKMKKKNSAICQRLYQMGLKKCWESCLDLMWTLKNLHTTLCNERPGIVPLFSPYAEALYRILGPRWQGSHVQGACYDWSGKPLPSMYPQPPMVTPPPVYQPWDYDMSASSGQLHGNPSMMVSSQYSLDLGSEAWNATYPRTVPHILPAFVPGDTNLQVPWSTYE
ncbi:uncharacterized protein MSANTD5-like [Arvicanthis niloticus]|uniref:uncharacterized protein MSANTD5-like n=1 Tax=Arvicanthis niloticus TaxID=61156 RepID=UPI00402B971D